MVLSMRMGEQWKCNKTIALIRSPFEDIYKSIDKNQKYFCYRFAESCFQISMEFQT